MKGGTPPLGGSQVSDKEDGDDVFNKIRESASVAYYVAKIKCEEARAQRELEKTLKANNKKKDKK